MNECKLHNFIFKVFCMTCSFEFLSFRYPIHLLDHRQKTDNGLTRHKHM